MAISSIRVRVNRSPHLRQHRTDCSGYPGKETYDLGNALEYLRAGARGLPRLRGNQARLATPAYAADVADQRPRCDRRRRRNRDRRRAQEHPRHRSRYARGDSRDQQRGRRLSDYRPDAPHVQDQSPHRRPEVMSGALQDPIIEIAYIVAVTLFILSLKWLSSPATARRGVQAGEVGMLIAILATLLYRGIVSYEWIIIGLVVGSLIGIPLGL